jgi:hypothetical protein
MIIHEINLFLRIIYFILRYQPFILLLIKVFKLRISFRVEWWDCQVRNRSESMANEYLLNLLIFLEVKNSKEYFLLLFKIFIDASLFNEWVNHLVKLILNDFTVWTISLDVVNHDNIVRSWISYYKFHVLVGAEFDHTVFKFAF